MKKEEERIASLKGLTEKQDAINDLIEQLEKVEAALVEKGAKTFKELYPEIESMMEGQASKNDDTAENDYSFNFSFKGVNSLTSDRQEAYLQL